MVRCSFRIIHYLVNGGLVVISLSCNGPQNSHATNQTFDSRFDLSIDEAQDLGFHRIWGVDVVKYEQRREDTLSTLFFSDDGKVTDKQWKYPIYSSQLPPRKTIENHLITKHLFAVDKLESGNTLVCYNQDDNLYYFVHYSVVIDSINLTIKIAAQGRDK